MDDLEKIINDKNQQINEMSSKIHDLERKLETQSDVNALFDSLEEKLKNFEKKFETADKRMDNFSNFVGDACSSIDDLVVELNDDIGNNTIDNEDENQLLRTFDNPFKWKCDICEFIAKSERGLKTHKARKHENCDWCDFICADKSEMKKHKMDKHTLQYGKEVLQSFM